MFGNFTKAENNELYVRLSRACRACDKMTGVLINSPRFHEWLDTWREINSLLGDLTAAY